VLTKRMMMRYQKMKDGKGNIVRTAEKIKELGAKTGNKTLPVAFGE
jgi:DNA recombination protein RmuC